MDAARAALEFRLLYPFDINFDYNLYQILGRLGREAEAGPAAFAQKMPVTLSMREEVTIEVPGLPKVRGRITSKVYPFGVGVVQVAFSSSEGLEAAARASGSFTRTQVDGHPIYERCRAIANAIIETIRPHAVRTYEARLDTDALFPVYLHRDGIVQGGVEGFFRVHERVLAGLVAGEPEWDRLSEFALQALKLENLGYYKDEIILFQDSGAFIASREEEDRIYATLEIAFAQRWALLSYNHLLNRWTDAANRIFAEVRKSKGIVRGVRIGHLTEKIFQAAEEKVALTTAIRDTTDIPRLHEDWHLARVYADFSKRFSIGELYRLVESRMNELEDAYGEIFEVLTQVRFFSLEVWTLVIIVLESLIILAWFLQGK